MFKKNILFSAMIAVGLTWQGVAFAQGDMEDVSVFVSCEYGSCLEKDRNVKVTEKKQSRGLLNKSAVRVEEARNVKFQRSKLPMYEKITRKTLAKAEQRVLRGEGKEMLDVVVYLEEQPFDFTRLRNVRGEKNKAVFSSVIGERRAQVSGVQSDIARKVGGLGGKVESSHYMTNMMVVKVPASELEKLSETNNVVGVELDGRTKSDADGLERRRSVGLPDGGMSGIDGGQGSTRSNDTEVLFGVIESGNNINISHLSFLDWADGPNRIISTDTCSSSSCSGSATTTSNSHGTNVVSVLAGSVEQNQNPSVTGATNQRRRSGIAKEAHIRYYNSGGFLSGSAEGIETAVAQGVDIINMSLSPTANYCSNESLSGVQGAIRAANDAGVLVIVTAGNDADDLESGVCSVSSMGAIPESLTVGATNDVSNLASMDTVGLAAYSGRGSTNVTLDGGRSASTRLVDLIVTGDADLVAGSSTGGTVNNTGTSFAAPLVAGIAGLLKDWSNDRGGLNGLENDPYALRTLLSVMADGVSSTNGGGSGYGFSVSNHSGFGHLRFIDLDDEIGSGGAWGMQRRFMKEGQVVEWPVGNSSAESTAVNGWKFAALWDWSSHGNSPDIKFELVDKCPSSGSEQVVRTAARHPLKARMRMRGSEMSSSFHGRCLWMRATVEHANGTVPVYTADYYYTNARQNHDMP